MAASTQSRLRLHVDNLDNHVIAEIAVCLSLHRENLKAFWMLVFDGPADVLMLPDREPNTLRGMLDPPLMTIHLSDQPRPLPDRAYTLRRPLDHGRLVELLSEAETRAAAKDPGP